MRAAWRSPRTSAEPQPSTRRESDLQPRDRRRNRDGLRPLVVQRPINADKGSRDCGLALGKFRRERSLGIGRDSQSALPKPDRTPAKPGSEKCNDNDPNITDQWSSPTLGPDKAGQVRYRQNVGESGTGPVSTKWSTVIGRQRKCWQGTSLTLLEARGQENGLTDYLKENSQLPVHLITSHEGRSPQP
jgi:hypothetical protein